MAICVTWRVGSLTISGTRCPFPAIISEANGHPSGLVVIDVGAGGDLNTAVNPASIITVSNEGTTEPHRIPIDL
jgi:hypothetical protein